MGIFDLLHDDWKKDFNESQKRAIEAYEKQLKAIGGILKTDWYKEIKSFWEREKESALQELWYSKNIVPLQEKYKIANSFLTFLNNFEKKLKKD